MAKQSTVPQVGEVEDLSTRDLLALVRQNKAAEDTAAANNLLLAAQWADMHPPESIGGEAVFIHGDHCEPIAGPGCPLVAEFCIAELGSVLGVSTGAAKKLIGHALELRHRLPRLWGEVHAARVPAWRARIVAETTIHASPTLTTETMAWVDQHVAPFAARMSTGQGYRLVEEAIRRQDPPERVHPDHDPGRPDTRRVEVNLDDITSTGTATISAEVDFADAVDVDTVLSQHARALGTLGNTASLDARRAMALGDLARTQLALDLTAPAADRDGSARPAAGAARPAGHGRMHAPDASLFTRTAREVVLHLHFTAPTAAAGSLDVDWLGRMEKGQRLVLLDHVKSWCRDSHTRVTIKPVIDLNTQITTEAYTPTHRLAEQVRLRDTTCVFPWCARPARRCDIDHVEPFDHDAEANGRAQPGPTTTSNLACLCRRHHRLKTHGRWQMKALESGVIEWTSPHGHRFLRDHTGTRPLDPSDDTAEPPERP